jgi:hypothetical protein
MSVRPFPQNVIAVIWDFDRTLLPGYMQEPLFEHYGVDGDVFWDEVNALADFYGRRGHELVGSDTIYLSHILTYVQEGRFAGLNNELLYRLGAELRFYAGLPDFLARLKQAIEGDSGFQKYDIKVEHYIVSTGLRQTILGSAINPHVEYVWACEFLESIAPSGFLDEPDPQPDDPAVVRHVGYAIDNTSKTRAIFEINKGVRQHEEITVNTPIAHEDRRVPFENMIYIADGPSDVPVFSILNQYGGKTYAVYDPRDERQFRQAVDLQAAGRVQGLGSADYQREAQTARWLTYWTQQIAQRIAERQAEARRESLGGKPPGHILGPAPETPQDELERHLQADAGRSEAPGRPRPDGDAPAARDEPPGTPEPEVPRAAAEPPIVEPPESERPGER